MLAQNFGSIYMYIAVMIVSMCYFLYLPNSMYHVTFLLFMCSSLLYAVSVYVKINRKTNRNRGLTIV